MIFRNCTVGGRRASGKVGEALRRRIGKCRVRQGLVPGERGRADAGRAEPRVAGFLAHASTLAETRRRSRFEPKVPAPAHDVLHDAEFAFVAAVLDDDVAETPAFRDVAHVAAAQQRRLLERLLFLDGYVGVVSVLDVGDGAAFRALALHGSVEVILPGRLGERFRTDGAFRGVLVGVVAPGIAGKLSSVEGGAVTGRVAGGQGQATHLLAVGARRQVAFAAG